MTIYKLIEFILRVKGVNPTAQIAPITYVIGGINLR